MFPSDLQKLLEMVREDAQRTVTMANGMQKQAARYVLLTPGQIKDVSPIVITLRTAVPNGGAFPL